MGFWCHDWASECLKASVIDTEKKQISLEEPHGYGIGPSSSWNKHPRRYYALNLLDELDRPGEWYLDRKRSILYFYPPKPLADARVILSTLTDPMVVLNDASHVTLQGLKLETSYGEGVRIHGGTANLVAGCTFVNLGSTAARDLRHEIRDRRLRPLSTRTSGDFAQRWRSQNTDPRRSIRPSIITSITTQCLQRTYAGAISVHGVGNRAANNLIHHAPHSAIFYGGNDHLIEFNEIHNVALETSDVGRHLHGTRLGKPGQHAPLELPARTGEHGRRRHHGNLSRRL